MKTFFLDLFSEPCPLSVDRVSRLKEETAVVVGNFDGFHVGHRFLIDRLNKRAKEKGLKSLVLMFCPHPLKFLAPEMFMCELSTPEEKVELIREESPVDLLCFIKFDEKFAKIRAKEFLKDILFEKLGCRHLLVGYDWRFGYRREGEIELAREVGKELGFEVELVQPFRKNGHIVSSTLIRRLLSEGRLRDAKEYLGRDYWVRRRVVKGDGLGSKIGFPTANLENTESLCLRKGVYAVLVDDRFPAVANYGCRPTFEGKERRLEVHIPGFRGDLLGREIRVRMVEFIREERKFSSGEELRRQIEEDIRTAMKILC